MAYQLQYYMCGIQHYQPNTNGGIVSRLREIREEKGLTQDRLAEIAGVGQSTVSAYEKGSHGWTMATVAKFAKALGVGVQDIIGEGEFEGMKLEDMLETLRNKCKTLVGEDPKEKKRLELVDTAIMLMRQAMEDIND